MSAYDRVCKLGTRGCFEEHPPLLRAVCKPLTDRDLEAQASYELTQEDLDLAMEDMFEVLENMPTASKKEAYDTVGRRWFKEKP